MEMTNFSFYEKNILIKQEENITDIYIGSEVKPQAINNKLIANKIMDLARRVFMHL